MNSPACVALGVRTPCRAAIGARVVAAVVSLLVAAPASAADAPLDAPAAADVSAAPQAEASPETAAASGTAAATETAAASEPAAGPKATGAPSAAAAATPLSSPERRGSLVPRPVEPPSIGSRQFQVDPIADGAIIAVSLGSAGVLELISSTGEIRPQQISPDFDTDQLIGIDRAAVNASRDAQAARLSNIGLTFAGAFALVDPVLSGVRERSVQTGLVDFVLYAESIVITNALTNVVKLAVRRPRPIAYMEAERHKDDPTYSNMSTDSSLSFFSGHSAMTAAIGATATYLAFVRSPPRSARPWVTLACASALSTLVSIGRVRAGYHFPTDVLAGTFAGAGIGVMVPHLHRAAELSERRVWIGFSPELRQLGDVQSRGGVLSVGGLL